MPLTPLFYQMKEGKTIFLFILSCPKNCLPQLPEVFNSSIFLALYNVALDTFISLQASATE